MAILLTNPDFAIMYEDAFLLVQKPALDILLKSQWFVLYDFALVAEVVLLLFCLGEIPNKTTIFFFM